MSTPNWVRWWFRGAALYGTAALLATAAAAPAAAALPFWGFVGTALAFQLAFWIIGGDPGRHRPLMPAAVAEKLAFVLPVAALAPAGRLGDATLVAAAIDAILGTGFLLAWRVTSPA